MNLIGLPIVMVAVILPPLVIGFIIWELLNHDWGKKNDGEI